MKNNFKLIFATLFAIILTGCGNITSSGLIIDKSSENSSAYLSSSLSSEANPDDSYYNKTIDDFDYYLSGIYSANQIWCWKKDDGHWYSGFPNQSSGYPEFSTINRMLEEKACPLPVMKDIIYAVGLESEIFKVMEVEYPMVNQAYQQVFFAYRAYASRNKELYDALGLLPSYEYYYGDDEYHDITSFIQDDDILLMHSKYFSYESHIYCWQNTNEEWRCGVGMEENSGLALYAAYWMQEDAPCTLSSMKRLIDTYYTEYKLEKNNKIIEIPLINSASEHRASMEGYPNNLSTNAYLYESLGLSA